MYQHEFIGKILVLILALVSLLISSITIYFQPIKESCTCVGGSCKLKKIYINKNYNYERLIPRNNVEFIVYESKSSRQGMDSYGITPMFENCFWMRFNAEKVYRGILSSKNFSANNLNTLYIIWLFSSLVGFGLILNELKKDFKTYKLSNYKGKYKNFK